MERFRINMMSYRRLLQVLLVSLVLVSCNMDRDYDKSDGLVEYPAVIIHDISPKQGSENVAVTITGENFGEYKEAAEIYFNGIVVPKENYISYTDKEVVVFSPTSTTGKVWADVWTSSDTADVYTYVEGASVLDLSPNTARAGDLLTLTGTNLGSNPSAINITFPGGEEAEVLSADGETITLTVPEGKGYGPLRLILESQQYVYTDTFTYAIPLGTRYEFEADDVDGWMSTSSTVAVAGGRLEAETSGTEASVTNNAVEVSVGKYPVLSVSVARKPVDAGQLKMEITHNGSSESIYGEFIHGDIYAFDMSNISTIADYEGTLTMTFSYDGTVKVGDNFAFDWIRGYTDIESVALDNKRIAGFLSYSFDTDGESEIWKAGQNSPYVVEDGMLKVTYTQSAPKYRADLERDRTQNKPLWDQGITKWSQNYPVLVLKGTNLPNRSIANLQLDARLGGSTTGNNKQDDSLQESHGIVYWNLAPDALNANMESANANDGLLNIKIPDIKELPNGITGYEVDWIRTFKSIEELMYYLGE